MNRHLSLIVALLAVALSTTPALAAGFYVGAGIGNTFVNAEISDAPDQITKIDENSTAWKIFGGFRHHGFFGIEGGYRDFGKAKSTVNDVEYEIKTNGWDFELIGRVPISIVEIFGKAGVMFWSSDGMAGGFAASDTGTDFLWGLGAGVNLGAFGVRLEWESLEISGPDKLSTLSLAGTFLF